MDLWLCCVGLRGLLGAYMKLLVTEAGIALQARRIRDGDLTEAQMREAQIPEWLIEEVKGLASEMRKK